MRTKPRLASLLGGVCALCFSAGALAQAGVDHAKADAEFAKFRAEMEDSNPAELNELKGEELWKAKRGPKNVSARRKLRLGPRCRQARRRLCTDATLFR